MPGGSLGRVPTVPVIVVLGTAPLPAGDARCPWIPVAAWCCAGCRCAARLDAHSCRGLCGVPALDGAGASVVRVASAASCWCGVATGSGGGAELDGPEDVEDIAADGARERTFVALVAVMARDRGGRVVMVPVLWEEEDEPLSRVLLAIILATAALPYVPGCSGGTCGCWARFASGWRLRGRGMPLHMRYAANSLSVAPGFMAPLRWKSSPHLPPWVPRTILHRPFRVPHQPAKGKQQAGGEGDDDGAVLVEVHGDDGAATVWQIANGG